MCTVQEAEWTATGRFDRSLWARPHIQVVAAWRPVPGLCRPLDELCHEHRRAFVPAIADGSTLCIGPAVLPGKSACWNCWELRSRQHAKNDQERSALKQYYEAHPQAGPAGFLEPFALMAAAKVASAIQSHDHLQQQAGQIWQVDMFTGQVTTGYVIGVDGCPRCGLGRPLATRTYEDIRESLAFLSKDRPAVKAHDGPEVIGREPQDKLEANINATHS